MRGQRVLVSGMGGELGSLVTSLLESEPWAGDILGIDLDPPRRRLRRAQFHRVDPTDRQRIVELVTGFDPHVVLHLAVYEPFARASATESATWTPAAALGVLGAAAECRSLEAIVVRSGISVYGRRHGSPSRPDESAPVDPTSTFGAELAHVEELARQAGRSAGVPVTAVRLAPVLGGHVPSPLGRLLRLPVVPYSLLADPPFVVVDGRDAGAALVAAGERRHDGPVNVAASGAITVRGALRRGNRIPWPLVGPQWLAARPIAQMLGAPVPDHVIELLHRGRLIDATAAGELLGVTPQWSTPQVIDALYAWESVIHVRGYDAIEAVA